MKKFIPALLGLLVLFGMMLALNLGGVVKTAIETAGTRATGTSVSVSGLDVSLADKTASMNGLSVANPKGFKADHLLKAKGISVTVGDITDKVVTIKEIVVDGMSVTYELGAQGTNLAAIQKNLKSAVAAQTSADSAGGPEMIIQQLKIIHAQVIPSVGGVDTPMTLPNITLNNIGSKNNPATPVEVAAQVINQVLASASFAVVKSGLAGAGNAALTKTTGSLKALLSK